MQKAANKRAAAIASRLHEAAARLHPARKSGAACVSLNPPPTAVPTRPLAHLLRVPRGSLSLAGLHVVIPAKAGIQSYEIRRASRYLHLIIPANSGIQRLSGQCPEKRHWTPASAGVATWNVVREHRSESRRALAITPGVVRQCHRCGRTTRSKTRGKCSDTRGAGPVLPLAGG